ncbi:hypothetical protein HMF8227_02629 [Saliniradius amylolyticus]|uniref:Cellulose-binding protein n=1 Tax=Saliniradius amylolyticus TaxID=2183582 RepID=A0A2S2E604_9ALTE|nr:PepSY-associated TM helix domain-containing protein [Saliniradius amylolyticus]AWL13081.1 hypothetical protein HMF8227_02629 [Saliniradius amylolyticus]
MRKQLFKLHGWLGLISLLPFLLICLTGSLLVFKQELDGLLMPEVAEITPGQKRLDYNVLIERINLQLTDYELGSWEVFNNSTEADRLYVIKQGTDIWHKAHLNPYTGELLSEPTAGGHYLTDWLLDLHYTLLLNDIDGLDEHLGLLITSTFAIFLIFLGISGLIIYRKFWKRLFTLRWNQRLLVVFSDLHKMVGTLASPILLILGITGGYYTISMYVHETLEHADGAEHHKITERLYNDQLDFQQLFTQADQYIEGFELTYIVMPFEPDLPITLYGRVPSGNPLLSNYASVINFDGTTGDHQLSYDIRQQGIGAKIIDSFRRLHFGTFAGITSKLIWCVMGLAPLLLGGTGTYLWFKRRQKRHGRRRQRRTGSAFRQKSVSQ